MKKSCEHCHQKISYPFLAKQKKLNTIQCPHCHATLTVTSASRILYGLLLVLPMIAIYVSDTYIPNSTLRLTLGSIWVIFMVFLMQPVIFTYKEQK